METRQMINLALACAANAERQGHGGLASALRELAEDCQLERHDVFASIRVEEPVSSPRREPKVSTSPAIESRSTGGREVEADLLQWQLSLRCFAQA